MKIILTGTLNKLKQKYMWIQFQKTLTRAYKKSARTSRPADKKCEAGNIALCTTNMFFVARQAGKKDI